MKQREIDNIELLRKNKPLVYAKALKFPEKVKNKESIASIQIQYKYQCNFLCDHCAIERFGKNKGRTLTLADVKSIADQADAMGLVGMSVSGGEPLMFNDLEDVVNAMGPERFNICMDTNGWLLDMDKLQWLRGMGVDRLHLSMDGIKENHDEFRKADGSWDRCVKALKYAQEINFPIIVNIVVTKSMIESGELIRQLEYLDGQYASLLYAKPTGSFEGHKEEILNTKDIAYVESLTKKYPSTTHLTPCYDNSFMCFAFKRHFAITAFGDVLPCPWIPISMGNIFTEKLNDIVERGLLKKWFTYDNKYNCQSGNTDSFFYQNIMPQINMFEEYPVDWRKINWYED